MFHGKPENADAGIKLIRNEAEPFLDDIPDCRGLAMLADRKSGQCIVTSSWEGRPAMLESDQQLRPLRDRALAVLGGSMQVEQWEIALMFRTQHGECCRVTWLRGDPDAMVESLCETALPRLKKVRGFCSASLLVNRSTGLGCITTAWESRAAMEAGHEAADDMRSQLEVASGGESVQVHEYDLVHAPARPSSDLPGCGAHADASSSPRGRSPFIPACDRRGSDHAAM